MKLQAPFPVQRFGTVENLQGSFARFAHFLLLLIGQGPVQGAEAQPEGQAAPALPHLCTSVME